MRWDVDLEGPLLSAKITRRETHADPALPPKVRGLNDSSLRKGRVKRVQGHVI